MQIEVDTSYRQYFEATRLLCLHTTKSRKWNFWMGWYGYPVLGAIFALLAVITWFSERRASALVVFNIMASVYLLWCRFGYPRRLRKMYSQQAKNFPGVMTLTPMGMRFERKNGSANTDYTWKAFESWMERPDMFLLFPSPLSFIRIPKNKLTDAEQDQVREWISASSKLLN
jgi:hypothetical protein